MIAPALQPCNTGNCTKSHFGGQHRAQAISKRERYNRYGNCRWCGQALAGRPTSPANRKKGYHDDCAEVAQTLRQHYNTN